MEFKVWVMYFITECLLSLTPGPAVLLVSSQGLKYGARTSYFGATGISIGNCLYFILSALGLGALILSAGNVFEYIRIAGSLYLIGSGVLLLYHSHKIQSLKERTLERYTTKASAFMQGLITQVSNPKAILFFVALLPQFVDPGKNAIFQLCILGVTTLVLETLILMGYGWISAKGKKFVEQKNGFRKWQDRCAGIVLMSLGIKLFFLKKSPF